MQLASKIGLIRVESHIFKIGGQSVLCVKRDDRVENPPGTITRWHQENTCQALGRSPHQKYQADVGPSAAEIVRLLDRFSDDHNDDIGRFTMALALNWITAGTDAHSKNYSLLHAPGSHVRLAPLYDLASYMPYQRDPRSTKVKLAMKIGGTYRLHEIDAAHWEKWAVETGLSSSWVKSHMETLIRSVMDSLEPTRDAIAGKNDSPFLQKLADSIAESTRKCAE